MAKQRDFFTRAQIVLLALDSKKIVKGIERKTGLPPVTIQRALKLLEELGLINSTKNKKMRFIELTEKGKKARKLLIQLWELLELVTTLEDTRRPPEE